MPAIVFILFYPLTFTLSSFASALFDLNGDKPDTGPLERLRTDI